MFEVEVWVVVGESGAYVVDTHEADALERFADDNGDECSRVICVKLKVPTPKVIVLEVTSSLRGSKRRWQPGTRPAL